MQTMIGFKVKNKKPGLTNLKSTQIIVSHWRINPSKGEFRGCRMHMHRHQCQLFENDGLKIDKQSIECKTNINWKTKWSTFDYSQTKQEICQCIWRKKAVELWVLLFCCRFRKSSLNNIFQKGGCSVSMKTKTYAHLSIEYDAPQLRVAAERNREEDKVEKATHRLRSTTARKDEETTISTI